MNARRPCPDSALLAAFIDGTLVDYERTAVMAHLADCVECRAVTIAVVEFNQVASLDDLWNAPPAQPTPVTPSTTRLRRWSAEKTRAPALAGVALAVTVTSLAISLPFIFQSSSSRQAVSTLVHESVGQRPIEARLSRFGYAPRAGAASGETALGRWRLVAAAGRIRDTYEDDLSVTSRQAVGVAALLVGQLDDAVASLSMAASLAPRNSAILNDLAAAYYERATAAARPDDLPRALTVVEKALTEAPASPEAWFNRALIIHALGLRAEARTAWQAYIERDPSSPWASEARARVNRLAVSTVAAEWATLRATLERKADVAAAEAAVGRYTSRTREFLERDLLAAWVEAARSGQDQRPALDIVRVLADAFARLSGDRLYLDALGVIDRVRARGASDELARLVAAHQSYLEGWRLMAATRFADAAPVLARAREQLAAVGSPLAIRTLVDTAATDYFAGRLEKADAALGPIKAQARAHDYAILVTRAAWLQGLVAFGQRDYAPAQIAYEEMLESARPAGDTDQEAMAHVLLANLHWVLGDAPTAWRHRVEAAGMLDDIYTPSTAAVMMLGAAGDTLASGNYTASLLFESALLAMPSLNPVTELQARAQHARTLHHLADQSNARAEVNRVRGLLSTISDAPIRARVEADVLTAEAEVLQRDEPSRALAAAERALTLPNVQLDHIRVARLNLLVADARLAQRDRAGAERAIAQGIDALEAVQSLPSAELRLGASDPSWSLYVRGIQLALERGDSARAFEYSERRRIRTAYERRSWGRTVLTLSALQSSLPPETAVAILNQLDDQLLVWVIRRRDVISYGVDVSADRAATLVASHLHEMKRATVTPAISGELFDILLRPGARALAGIRNVVVVADAPYHRVAFAGLWDARRNRYVVEDHAVTMAPSVTAYAWAVVRGQQHPWDGPRHAVVFEAPTGAPILAAALRDQDHHLGTLYGSARLRRGETATPSRLLAGGGERDVVHVSAALIANDEFPVLSRLRLADEPGRKYSGSILARRVGDAEVFRARLVVLETSVSQSPMPRSEGHLGFTRALLAAGVPNVVSPVAEMKTSDLGQTWLDFHRYYASGSPAAESLRRAQLAALRDSSHRPGPWAMLAVFGSAQ